MEVSIQHIIGTVTLISLVISAGLFYNIFTTYLQDDNNKKELQQISENTALNIEEMINLAKFSKYNIEPYMVKILDLPIDVGGKSYQIELVDNGVQGFSVRTFLSTKPTINSESMIPYNSGEVPLKLETTQTVNHITVGVENLKIACSGTVYGKNSTTIWANLDWSNPALSSPTLVTIGIGWVEAQQ